MKETYIGADDLITTFAQQRQVLLRHTADVLCPEPLSNAQGSDREAKLSAILLSSLEELKVAEEELVERTGALANLRDELEQRLRGVHQLFDLAPACLLVTDAYGTILEVNRACSRLLKRDVAGLERQPLVRFILPDQRRAFRDGLSRLVTTEGVSDWRLTVVRPTDGALGVSAAVHVVKSAGNASGVRLFWAIRVIRPTDAVLEA